MRIDRMLAITVMLLNRERIPAKEFADKFEVSVRTIYRDIEAINMAGIPVISYQGNNGGFGLMENYRFDRQLLTLDDMIAMISALKGLSDTLDYKELDGAIEKITSLMPGNIKERDSLLNEQLVIDILPWGYRQRQKQILQSVHDSVRKRRIITLAYRNASGETSLRDVEPMTLIFKEKAWYLFAWCRMKQDYRIFRLSRVSSLEVRDESFERRNASYRDYMGDETGIQMIDIILRFDPRVRVHVEDWFEPEDIRDTEDGFLEVNISLPEDDWLLSMILSYGDSVEVISPAYLRQKIAEKTKKNFMLYQT